MVSLTHERIVGLLNENQSYSIPPLLSPAQTELLTHPTLLPGEKILLQQDATCVDTFTSFVKGILHLTTFRIIFNGTIVQDIDDEATCDDDAQQVARKGYIYQSHRGKSKGHSTLERLRQKTQNFQESIQLSTSLTLRPSSRRKSKDLPRSDNANADQVSLPRKKNSCRLISVQPVLAQEIEPKKDPISHSVVLSIPCTNIYEVRKFQKNSLKKDAKLLLLHDGVELLCSTLQTYKFCLPVTSTYDGEKLTIIITKYTKHLSPSKWFAIAYREALLVPQSFDLIRIDPKTQQNVYNFHFEIERLGLLKSNCWREYVPDQSLNLKSPLKTLVPYGISDEKMKEIIHFHGGKSYPAICWRNPSDDTIMLRSGAAYVRRGLFESRCEADEGYLASICYQNKQSCGNKLVVFTEQSRNDTPGLLAAPQQISGQITPKQGEAFCYPHCKFVYTEKEVIPDYKTVRESSHQLQTLLSSSSDDRNFLSALAETQWLSQISELLETASLIITALNTDKSSVLISYETGCDRTAQLSSLSQLLLDPYYRTIDGFQVLIQKEWLSFGHMFAERCVSQKCTDGPGPIFLQWLDCVWQLINQFPLSFEFNEAFLQLIASHAYSCRFGTFLCDSEQEYIEEKIESKTLSLWTWINLTIMADPERFLNQNFRKTKTERILLPRYHIFSLKVWESFYAKTRIEENLQEAMNLAQDQASLVGNMYAGLLNKYIGLVNKMSELQDDGVSSESSFELDISSMLSTEANDGLIKDVFEGNNSTAPEIKSGSLKTPKHRESARSLESRSLDNLLGNRRVETQSKIRRVLGSTKSRFYVHKPPRKEAFSSALAGLDEVKPGKEDNVRESQIYDGLCEYLRSEGFEWSMEQDLEISPATCCGFLIKRGNVRKNWLSRWFMLDLRKKYLAYFENRESECPKGVIECDKIVSVYPEPDPRKIHKHKFYVATDDRTFEFKAYSKKIMKIWLAILSLPSANINIR